jgi:hypothetical protein
VYSEICRSRATLLSGSSILGIYSFPHSSQSQISNSIMPIAAKLSVGVAETLRLPPQPRPRHPKSAAVPIAAKSSVDVATTPRLAPQPRPRPRPKSAAVPAYVSSKSRFPLMPFSQCIPYDPPSSEVDSPPHTYAQVAATPSPPRQQHIHSGRTNSLAQPLGSTPEK